jgi:hypothetical protein
MKIKMKIKYMVVLKKTFCKERKVNNKKKKRNNNKMKNMMECLINLRICLNEINDLINFNISFNFYSLLILSRI